MVWLVLGAYGIAPSIIRVEVELDYAEHAPCYMLIKVNNHSMYTILVDDERPTITPWMYPDFPP